MSARGSDRSDSARTPVAVYRRKVQATLERVWENVYDWEHLPWLHSRHFSRIELRDSGAWGWRALLEPEPPTGRELLIEVRREGREDRYVTRTLEGPGAGTEIWTTLVADGDATNVAVEFYVPGGSRRRRRAGSARSSPGSTSSSGTRTRP
ncbi:MAG: hypothetical protein ACE5FL_10420 [Myxococcota bacterium]